MPNKIFQAILNSKMEEFAKSFVEDADSIFYDESNNLIHPGEYGSYKERTLKRLFELLIPTSMKLGDGFIITSTDKKSTQCDLVIYDSTELPLLSDGISSFFPIESVLAIGEVKSKLSRSKFIDAIRKLARNNQLQDERKGVIKQVVHKTGKEYENLVSFLVCSKLDFNIKGSNLNIILEEAYEGIDKKYWHNFILSMDQGIIGYGYFLEKMPIALSNPYYRLGLKDNTQYAYEYPLMSYPIGNYNTEPLHIPSNESLPTKHIEIMLVTILKCLMNQTKYSPDFLEYSDLPSIGTK